MMSPFDSIPETTLADYEGRLKQAGYLIFEHAGDWYYNEIGAGDELSDGPYTSRAEVLHAACKNLHLVADLPRLALSAR